ncbi:unnamed protein product [Spirodela intermedia]|uniref:Vacuolar iron transporter n=1 Tax=Spirodela intermedia TaxID=51605 RepID=A0A7I8IZQ6_SPIIN|nr:unnamed protein product [Spirodela intermedia]CAA6663367.1 unnamed protein product [Spirodela intermedia]
MGQESAGTRGPWSGDRVRSIVYAGLDSIVTSFSLISSISGGRLSSGDVVVLGLANLVADGIAMGFGDFVSSSTERDMVRKARAVLQQGLRRHIRPQLTDLLHAYQALGMATADATTVVSVLAKYEGILVDEKMSVERGMLPPRQMEVPWKSGLITFLSFVGFGSAPLLAFGLLLPFAVPPPPASSPPPPLSVAATLFNGALASASAYTIGSLLSNLLRLE